MVDLSSSFFVKVFSRGELGTAGKSYQICSIIFAGMEAHV